MKCPYCGKELTNGLNHCDGCGASINSINVTTNSSNNMQENNNKSNKKNILIIACIIIITLVLLFIFDRDEKDKSNSGTIEESVEQVSGYIDSSKRSTFLYTIESFVDSVRTKVNQGKEFQLFEMNTLYFVPVGDNKCIKVEYRGKSPFSDVWDYNYIGVVYTGSEYRYYAIAQDGSGKGIKLMPRRELSDSDVVYDSYKDVGFDSSVVNELEKLYKIEENIVLKASLTDEEKNSQTVKYGEISNKLIKVLTPSDADIKIEKYIFIASLDNCSYKTTVNRY